MQVIVAHRGLKMSPFRQQVAGENSPHRVPPPRRDARNGRDACRRGARASARPWAFASLRRPRVSDRSGSTSRVPPPGRVASSAKCVPSSGSVRSSNCATVIETSPDFPPVRIVTFALLRVDRVRLASSTATRNSESAAGSFRGSAPCFSVNSSARYCKSGFVPIAAAETHIAVGGQGSHLAGLQLDDGYIERASAEIVHEHVALARPRRRTA